MVTFLIVLACIAIAPFAIGALIWTFSLCVILIMAIVGCFTSGTKITIRSR